ncbi:DUF948 domain-containing protein [Sporosarcina luteola]|uniref:DUF948 domain-containing protein n=1 Tax=Sporosarcina luteola TaxID=582850 RepID=UPI00203EDB68|nr:DUF948 domain-containing protein [Sporosarcina luteola]MCM3710986.1 DUF948 domain-containing protein [Sporosarcina luteola]
MMLVQIGVFLIAISFAIFAIALSKLLLRASSGVKAIRTATGEMESKLDGTLQALEGTLDETNRTISDMDGKLNALNSVFLSVEKFGGAANIVGEELNELTKTYVEKADMSGVKPFIRTIQSAEFAKKLLESWKRGRSLSETRKERAY